jgi:hypothetical protein
MRSESGPSLLERVDLVLASRLVVGVGDAEPIAVAQRVLDQVRRPAPSDAVFAAGALRLRGFVVTDEDAVAAVGGGGGVLSPLSQEYRLLRGLRACLEQIRGRAAAGLPPDGWFATELFRTLTAELPRFRNNELRRGAPWDAVLYVTYPQPEELRFLLSTFDLDHHYRDQPALWQPLHPVRQGFRILWRFARLAPFPDFNLVLAWLLANAWLQWHGYPLLPTDQGDQQVLQRLLSGPPPSRILPFEARLLERVDPTARAG